MKFTDIYIYGKKINTKRTKEGKIWNKFRC